MTAIAPEPTTTPTPVNWETLSLPDGDAFTTAHIGAVTVGRTRADVILDLNPDGAAKGRTGPGLFSAPGIFHMGFQVEHADVAPWRYLVAAPVALLDFRKVAPPAVVWQDRTGKDGSTVTEALLATIHTPDGDVPVVALLDTTGVLADSSYCVATLPPPNGRVVVFARTRDIDVPAFLGQVRDHANFPTS